MRNIFKNILISVLSLGVTFTLCEIGSRFMLPPAHDVEITVTPVQRSDAPARSLADDSGAIAPVIDWSGPHGVRLFPNVTATIHNHTLSKQDVILNINSLGLRGPELKPEKGDEFRILAIGDSITLGDYVAQDDTIPGILERSLRSLNPKTIVMNAGLPGANTSDEYYHYVELADTAKPDIVLLGMYLNDAQNSGEFYAKKLTFPFNKSRFLSFVAERINILNIQATVQNAALDPNWRESFRAGRNLTTGPMFEDRNAFDFEIYNAHQDFGLAWNEQAWKNLTEITDTFARSVKQHNQKLLVYYLPIHIQVFGKEESISRYPQEQFKKMCETLNLTCLDLLPQLREAAKDLSVHQMYYDHCHYRKEGNELIAKILTDWIKKDVSKN